MNSRSILTGLIAFTAALPVFAEVQINENLAISGYATGSIYRATADGSPDVTEMELDSSKVAFHGSFQKVSGVVSLHTFDTVDPKLLDAYVTYNAGTGSVTFGKFLSYLGFEAFDYPNMLQISYANDLAGFVPAYHTGVKFDLASRGGFEAGVAVLDSVYGPSAYEGDHDLENGAGYEGFLKYSTGASTAFLGLAYDESGPADQFTADLWVQTVIGSTTLAAEFLRSEIDAPGGKLDGYFWMGLAMQSFNNWSVTARISGGEDETAGPDAEFMKYTLSPAVVLTDNLGLLFEYSYTKFDNTGVDDASFLGAQFVFKF